MRVPGTRYYSIPTTFALPIYHNAIVCCLVSTSTIRSKTGGQLVDFGPQKHWHIFSRPSKKWDMHKYNNLYLYYTCIKVLQSTM